MNNIFERLKKVSVPNRTRIIEQVGLDFKHQQLLILKYCELLSRDKLAERFCVSVDTIDKATQKAREQFINIIQNEYDLFTDEQRELLSLIYDKNPK